MRALVTDLNVASNKGLAERFDSTIGAATVLMPFGGRTQLTPPMAMVAKLPVDGETTTCSGMAWGFNPYLMSANCYTGAYLSVVESVSRMVAAGFDHEDLYLTFQEYFERLRDVPSRWGKPTAALLGALMAQVDLGIASIGGKDSMSGSFEDLDVPPTLVSFATGIGHVDRVVSPEFKGAGHRVAVLVPDYADDGLTPDPKALLDTYRVVEGLVERGEALAVSTLGYGGVAEAVFKMCVGNRVGIEVAPAFGTDALFCPSYGSFLVEITDDAVQPEIPATVTASLFGTTTSAYELVAEGERIDLAGLQDAWEGALEGVFPYRAEGEKVEAVSFDVASAGRLPPGAGRSAWRARASSFPVFPGTNCEYDTAHAFERAGAVADVFVINNLTPEAVAESTHELARRIRESQIVMIPGGFSGGDEPEGSAKFITAFFRAPEVTEAVRDLLQARDGLMLGICNGFQALVKLGLVPYGDIRRDGRHLPHAHVQHDRPSPEPPGAHARGVQPEPVALQVRGRRRPQHRDLARRGPLRGVRRAGRAARGRRPGGHAVRGRGRRAGHGRWTSTPTGRCWRSRASPRRTGACWARWATPSALRRRALQERAGQRVPAAHRGRRGVLH